MKKLIFFLFLASSLFAFGQSSHALQGISSIKFYGIDYSMVRIYGASESPTQFKSTFNDINELFLSQPKKYNVSKFTGKQITGVSLEAVNQINGKINVRDLETTNSDYTLDATKITEAIRQLPIAKEPGTGMVLIAKLLNKVANQGSYQAVYFNTETKEIIDSLPINGKAAGFGLRNFWAGSVYKALKKID